MQASGSLEDEEGVGDEQGRRPDYVPGTFPLDHLPELALTL